MNFNFFVARPLIISILSLILGIFVFTRNKFSRVNLAFLIICISVFIWLFFESLIFAIDDSKLAIIYAKILYLGVIFVSSAIYHFTIALLKIRHKKLYIQLAYCVSLIFSIILFSTSLMVRDIYDYKWGFYPQAGVLNPLYILYYSSLYSYSLFKLFMFVRRKDISNLERNRVNFVFYSLFIPFFCIFDFGPNYGFSYYPVGHLFIIAWLSITAYAIVRYRLMDISLAITRTSIFVAVYSLVLGLPFVVAYSQQTYLMALLGSNWWLVPLILSTILATAGPFIYLYIQHRAEERLLREQRRYQATLRQASVGMTRVRDLQKLLNLIVHIVTRTVRLKHGSIYLLNEKTAQFELRAIRDKGTLRPDFKFDSNSALVWNLILQKEPLVYEEVKQKMQDYKDVKLAALEQEMRLIDAAVVVPSFVEEKLLGFIVLGEKLSGKIYSQDDLSVFSVLANQAALAIENNFFIAQVKVIEQQLAQSEKLAAIGRFASSIAHEVKNPLTPIKTFAEYLPQKHQDKDFVDKYSQIVSKEVNRIDSLVHQLLDFSKPSPLKLEEVDIHKLLDETLDLLSNDFIKHRINVEKQYFLDANDRELKALITANIISGNSRQESSCLIKIDANRMKQAFLNLFLNSIEAMPSGGTLTVSTNLCSSGASKSVLIYVKDTGMGIPDESLKRIFEPFYTTKEKGTGLGLAIVYSIIKEHQGNIRVESEVGRGTMFVIELPAQKLDHRI